MLLTSRQFQLPEYFRKKIIGIVERANENDVMCFVENRKEFRGGMRTVAPLVPRFKEALVEYFSVAKEISAEEAEFLYMAGIGHQFVVVLSLRAIECGLPGFRACYGSNEFLLAMLLDKRDEVFALGVKALEESDPREMTQAEGAAYLKDSFTPFLMNLGVLFVEDNADKQPPSDAPQKEVRSLQRELKKKEREIDALRNLVAEEREKLSQIEQDAQKKDKRRIDEIATSRKEMADLQNELSDLEKKYRDLESSVEDNIAKGTEKRLGKISCDWLQKSLGVEGEVKNTHSDDLLASAQQELKKQAALDRKSGSRQALQKKLASLRKAYTEVHDAILHAINLNPELPLLATKIQNEISKYEQMLWGTASEEHALTTQSILQQLQLCDSFDALEPIQALVSTLESHNLPRSESQALRDAICTRMNILIAKEGGCLESLTSSAVDRLVAGLKDGEESLVFLDGHNIINLLPRFAETCKQDHSLGRNHLVETVSTFAKDYPHCHFRIVFDGPERVREEISNHITVEFSGGGTNADQRADKYIMESISWVMSQADKKKVYLVTSDKDFGRQSREHGVEVIPAFHIEQLI